MKTSLLFLFLSLFIFFSCDAESSGSTNNTSSSPSVTKNYQVTFNVNGGSSIDSLSIKEGQKITKPQNPTRTGYTFDNWYQDQALTTIFDFNTVINADTTLYASWYIPLKQRDSSKDFTFSTAKNLPFGALYHQDHFYIVDHNKGYIYAFDKSGNAVTSKDLKNFTPANYDLNGLTYHNGIFYSYNGSGGQIVAINEDGSLNTSETFSPAKEGAPAYYDGAIYTIRSDGIFAYDVDTKNANTSKNITYTAPASSSVYGGYLVYKNYLYLVYNKSRSPFKVVCINLKDKKVETSRGFDIARDEWTGLYSGVGGLMFYDGNFYLVSSDFSSKNKIFVFGAGKL